MYSVEGGAGSRRLGDAAAHGDKNLAEKTAKAALKPDCVVFSTEDERKRIFEELAWPIMDGLYSLGLRLQRSPVRAEDLVQETLLRAWMNFDRFSRGTNFKAWLFQIMTYLHLNERRGAHHRETPVDFSGKETSPPPGRRSEESSEAIMAASAKAWLDSGDVGGKGDGPSVAALLEVDWMRLYGDLVDDALKTALDRLGEEQRLVFLLVTLGELSYQECADALSIPVGTVMSRLFRARRQLQEELAEYAREKRIPPAEGKL
jgi:RNA polymerase sigma-70 factor (ECF subfamily)